MELSQQNFCCFCLNKDLLCSSEKIVLDLETLQLLKFLVIDVNVDALENVMVGMGCLEKIADASEYKCKNLTISLRILKDKMIKLNCKYTICQKCETVLQRNDAFRLVDCVTKINWLDFVNYLFKNPDLEYLESSHICHSCQISVINIQDILKLLYVYDQSKMQFNIDNCNDTTSSDDNGLAENETEIKRKLESNDVILLDNLIKNDHIEKICINDDDKSNNYISYEDFELKNEEIDLKFEASDDDNINIEESTHKCEKVDSGKEISNDSHINSTNEKEGQEVIYPEVNDLGTVKKSNYLECKVDTMTNQAKQYEMCRSRSTVDQNNYTENKTGNGSEFRHNFGVKKLIDYRIAKKMFSIQPSFKPNVNNDSVIFKCQYCTYETRNESNLTKHIQGHENIKDFKCTFCSKAFTNENLLDDHLSSIHECRDVRKKQYNCDHCNYVCLYKKKLLLHKIKHGITDGFPILKCYQCTYETYYKSSLIRHVKTHQTIKDFKCTDCSKKFSHKINLNRHLLRIHKKLYNCDQCGCEYVRSKHKIKHSTTDGFPTSKCYQCTFESYCKGSLYKHVKKHENIKHGITDGIPIFKCNQCPYETYGTLTRHVKMHEDIKSILAKSNLNRH